MQEDSFLIKQVLNGDNEAYDILMKRYEKKVFNLSLRILGNYEDAADATQEAFIRAYKSLKTFRNDSKFSTWVCRIVTNVSYDFLRKRKKVTIVSIHTDNDDNRRDIDIPDTDVSSNPADSVTRDELRKAIVEAIASLEPAHRDIIVLRDIKGFSYKEIGDQLNIAEGTVKSRLNRARIKVSKILKNSGELLPPLLRQTK
ncbi:RNA polymerase sigma factor [Clostridium sp. 'deep sea']|uniref:RNA polymerase sigma factor n=1 Tax=Clostridium sp. 'deep sea' TaxID=2779445 RepID=UPI0018965ECE|nr:RNA polymerase sigma factor [Clostridium sp. 'deep sea']QOR36449.1 RNA polymerase sigma factor [Clostridium sp. 'deep sea']